MRIGLDPTTVSGLKIAQLLGLGVMSVNREGFINEKVPNFLATIPGIQCFILRIADATELLIGLRWLSAVTLTDELNDTFALINLLAQ